MKKVLIAITAILIVGFPNLADAEVVTNELFMSDPDKWIGRDVELQGWTCTSTVHENKKTGKGPGGYGCVTIPYKESNTHIILKELPPTTSSYLDYVCYSMRFGVVKFNAVPECRANTAKLHIIAVRADKKIEAKPIEINFAQPLPMNGNDFLVDWRELQKKSVTVKDCDLSSSMGRVLGGYIHCSFGSGIFRGANRILIEEKSFARESYRRYLDKCVGKGRQNECRVDLIGIPSGEFAEMPIMRQVHAVWHDK